MAALVLVCVLTICFSLLVVYLLKMASSNPPIQPLDFETPTSSSTAPPETVNQRIQSLKKQIKQNVIRKLESKQIIVNTVYTGNPYKKGTQYNPPNVYQCYPYQNSYDYSKEKAPNHSTFFVVNNSDPDSDTPPFTQISLPVLTLNYVYYVINVSNSPCYLYYGQNIKQEKKELKAKKRKIKSDIKKVVSRGGIRSGGGRIRSGGGGRIRSGGGGRIRSGGGGGGLPGLLPRIRGGDIQEGFETPSESPSESPIETPSESPSESTIKTPSESPIESTSAMSRINYILQNVLLTKENALVLPPNTFAIMINIGGGYCILSSTRNLYPIPLEEKEKSYTPTPYPYQMDSSTSSPQSYMSSLAPLPYPNNTILTGETKTSGLQTYSSPKNVILSGIPPMFYNYLNVELTTQSTIYCPQNLYQEKLSGDNFLSLPFMDTGAILYVQNDNTFNNLVLMYEQQGFYTNYGEQDVIVMGGNSFVLLIYTTDKIAVMKHENIILNDSLSSITSQAQCQGTYGYCPNTGIHYCSTQCSKTATCPETVITSTNHMSIGDTINLCGKLVSQNEKYTLLLQSNGNLGIFPSSSIGTFTNENSATKANSISLVTGKSMLESCQSISSVNGMYELLLQSDGNLILYSKYGSSNSDCKVTNTSSIIWSSKSKNGSMYTSTNTITNPFLTIQSDNNLVLYGYINGSSQQSVLWTANTENTQSDTLQVFNTGNFSVFDSTTGYVFYDSNSTYNAGDSASATPLTSIYAGECNFESTSQGTAGISTRKMIWSAMSYTYQISNISLVFEEDGNLALYVGYNTVNPSVLWSTETSTTGSDTAILTNKGTLMVYNSNNGRIFFESSVGKNSLSANNNPNNYILQENTIPSSTVACRSFPTSTTSIMSNFTLQNPVGYFVPSMVVEFTGKLPFQLDYVDIPLPTQSIFRLPFKTQGNGNLMITLPVYEKVYNGTIYYFINQNNFSDIILKCPTYGTFSNFEGMSNQDTVVVAPTEYVIVMMLQQSWYITSMSFLDENLISMETESPSPF